MPRIVPKEWIPWFTLQNGYFMATHLLKHVYGKHLNIYVSVYVCACVTLTCCRKMGGSKYTPCTYIMYLKNDKLCCMGPFKHYVMA